MELIHADDKLRQGQIERLYLQSFPKNERKPFRLLCQKKQEGVCDLLSIEENGEFSGLAITARHKDKVLLDYFAMEKKERGKGRGSAALLALQEYYKGCPMVLEIEATTENAENLDERIRRKRFYLKNGMTELGLMAELFGVTMELLSNGTKFTFDEYLDLYRKTFGNPMAEFVRPVKSPPAIAPFPKPALPVVPPAPCRP